MLIRLAKKYRTLLLYGILGSLGALVDFIVYLLLVKIFSIPPSIATFLSVSCGILTSFILNSRYNFKKTDHTLTRFGIFYVIGLAGAILSVVIIFVLFNIIGLDSVIAKVISIPIVVITQYKFNSAFSFSDDPKKTWRAMQKIIAQNWYVFLALLMAGAIMYVSMHYLVATDDMDNMLSGKMIATEGMVPYRDFFSHHSPGMYYLSAAIYPFTNNEVFTYRALYNLLLYIILIITYIVLSKRVSKQMALAWVVLYSLSFIIAWKQLPLAESFIASLLPLILTLTFFPQKQTRKRDFYIASLLLFMVPLFSLGYIFLTIPLYAILAWSTFKQAEPSTKITDTLKLLIICALPYALSLLYLVLNGALHDAYKDLMVFNSVYYAPMVGETGGGIINTFLSSVYGSAKQIAVVIRNAFQPGYSTQLILIFGVCLAAFHFVKERKFILSAAVLALLLLVNTRTNIFNVPAIESAPNILAQHGAIYFAFALFWGTYISITTLSKNNLKLNPALILSILFLVVIPYTAFVSSYPKVRAAISPTSSNQENYKKYSEYIKHHSVAEVINAVSDPNDTTWIAPQSFVSELYLESKNATRYTFYMPWLDSSPDIRNEVYNSIKTNRPKVIYYKEPFSGKDSLKRIQNTALINFISENYFTIQTPEMEGYFFRTDAKQSIIEELQAHGYRTN